MKKWILTALIICLASSNIYAQAKNFDGLWEGNIESTDGESVFIRLFIEDNNVYLTDTDEDGDLAKNFSKEVIVSKGYGGQLNAFWMDSGGVWTETQFYSLSWTSSNKLSIYHTRHVSNESDDTNGYTDWGYSAVGTLIRNDDY
ncbi:MULTISPECIES: hypothetical protein [Nonlabens]|uniref:Lipocalin-like protein n=1 Tax=Nonlabens xylanidelens TaxID=191564 RepID=A0A2S6IFP5_9FLAO|nr:hypothetical protein [Nonlabens xylanidelens]PPK93017.1 hypothetical protein LY01_02722 [Nonlabens xylanidelens]PQJ18775.1 hypothetical protein BST94_07090 [Nonlabens xylanidelens]